MPAFAEATGWCDTCGQTRTLRRKSMSGWAHAGNVAMAIATVGIWLLVYQRIWRITRNRPWKCVECGNEGHRGFDHRPSAEELDPQTGCAMCRGTGACPYCDGYGQDQYGSLCTGCNGGACRMCMGAGRVAA